MCEENVSDVRVSQPGGSVPRSAQQHCRAGLGGLPNDLLYLILSYLETGDLLACNKVCTVWRHLIATHARLQLTIELGITGLIEGPALHNMCMADRLKKLREWGTRMRTSDFTRRTLLECATGDIIPLATVYSAGHDGISFSYHRRDEDGGQLMLMLKVHTQPSILSTAEGRTWERPVPEGVRVLAVDIIQNLVVTQCSNEQVSITICFMVLEDWEPHPKATCPNLPLRSAHPESLWAGMSLVNDVKVYGRYVAWNVVHDYTRVVEVWDWQAGTLIWGPTPSLDSCAFLDSEHILTLSIDWNKLIIHRFVDSHSTGAACNQSPRLESSGRTGSDGGGNSSPLVALALPQGAYNCSIDDSATPAGPTPPPSALFWPDPAQRAIVITFEIVHSEREKTQSGPPYTRGGTSRCILLIPYSTFRKHIDNARACPSSSSDRAVPVVAWRDWSQRGSLLLRDSVVLPGSGLPNKCYPHGSQLTLFKASGPELTSLKFDINPWAGLRDGPTRVCKGDIGDYIGDFSDCEADYDDAEADRLESALPAVVYRGLPAFPQPHLDGDRFYEIASHQSGFTVVTFERDFFGERVVAAETLYV